MLRYRVLLIASLAVLAYVAWLGLRDFWYPGEPDLAEVCRAMFDSGDWIVPRRNGEVYLNYGPMLFWTGTASARALGGLSEFALRLPGALGAVLLVLGTCIAGSRWFGPRAGLWAGLLLLAAPQFTWQAVGYRPDMLFALFVAAGILVYASGAGEKRRLFRRVVGFALLGLAVLVKGPLGLLLPGLVLALWHGARREWRRMLGLAPLALVALAVAVPWYAACGHAVGMETLTKSLMGENVGRFASGETGHGRPPWYYLTRIWADLAPWALLLPFAVFWAVRRRVLRDGRIQLLLWWLGAFLVFFSIAATKRQLYLLPAYPPMVLLIARYLTTARGAEEAPDPRPARLFAGVYHLLILVTAVLAVAAAATLGLFVERLGLDATMREIALALRLPLVAVGALLGVVWLWVRVHRRRDDTPAALLRLALGQVLLFVLVLAVVLPTLDPANTYAPAGARIAERLGRERVFGFLGSQRKIGAFGYYTGAIIKVVEDEQEVSEFFREHPRSIVVVDHAKGWKLLKGGSGDWRKRVVDDFTAARRRYVVLRGP